jgi:hypothetical protein
LAFGVDQLPAWGLAIFEQIGFSEHRRPRTFEVTTAELQEWLELRTGPEAAIALARTMADEHPDLFTDTAKPPTEARTGEMCSRIGTWEGGDQHHELIDIKVGETFPSCPSCGRAIGWTYLHE